ncbi:prenyltransferase/squalene oxidase repeat-containing protein [Ideonella sp. A 288]|uniref:prenyltransferase/squalene oxidase repeat-containing protein n=1 Tax=Ideonella sp. A 288 TaxID=1962181 RepID=UPI0013030FCB|nr:prenyltransferase/squalene oxidase repeat-containing protein [Ideonella sp. A 288]
MKRRHVLAVPALAMLAAPAAHAAADAMDPQLRRRVVRAIAGGLHYLRGQQAPDGSLLKSVGITALALRAFLESPEKYNEADGAFVTRQVDFLLSHAKPDGSISASLQSTAYNTAVALNALAATKNPKHTAVIEAGRKFLSKHQIDEEEGYKPDHVYYGGIGYGGGERPDLSNVYVSLEGLKAAATDPKDAVWQKALMFVNRSQNRSESNDQKWAANDGGFAYRPGTNPPEYENGTASYGGMTAAGLLSLLFAGVDKSDPRVQAAYKWMTANYTLDTNPGTSKKHGIFYFYNAFSKVMAAYGEDTFTDGKGQKRNWRNELAQKLLSLQSADGSWANAESNAWWEDRPQLVTSWSVIALEHVLK